MESEFTMSLMGELTFFLGLQIKQINDGIFINQSKYIKDMLKKFKMNELKGIKTLMDSSIKLDKDEKGKDVDQKSYRGIISSLLYLTASKPEIHFSFLGHALVYWFSKKQISVALSIVDAEYIAAESYVAQIFWMKQQLNDYGIEVDHIPIRCDNTSTINLTKNPIQHSRTKHIKIKHHFIRDHVQNGDIELEFVSTQKQLADIFTKPLNEDTFCRIRRELGMIDLE
ncbi:hypothetical protein MANES_09G075219v8 [Manihot esculenta]|uniref:Uncharacterized protein n=1 Tax=Manihot esculenta TaxID=3983 RepID=A0ACB7H711_MANES|nr:hypothetical protein MANES_09G075219v8 [Manihot esculenta]